MILTIYNQFVFLIFNFIAGILAASLFDVYRVIRRFGNNNKILTVIQDILFLILSAIIIFTFLLYTNEAYLNGYVYIFMLIGVFFYMKLLSKIYIKFVSFIFNRLLKTLRICKNFMVFIFECIFLNKK
ncbi:spore cortex biosynthesis protein YabQ [Clostridium hydrogenum]|uniref:spore cortex biosynthesis protein YabQ n=1 Tax=Clostridium hydrogenum TaxID=2855764 RepID=UPI001F45403E|nr:spore cortex biosynthesis protein YabQ [Clostridium hydrogenum]